MSYRVAVAVSGRGSNLTALADDLSTDDVARVVLAISDRQAPALAHAAARGIAAHRLDDHRDAAEWIRALDQTGADLLVLAGYLKLVPTELVSAWMGRIINIHPALLPLHGGTGKYGARVHAAVLAAGDRESGATVHLVDEVYDRGAVLGAGRVSVAPNDTAETLAERVLAVEHRLLPAAVRAAAEAGRPVPFEFT